ncbi:uncharacterized protein LOC129901581 isoform X3 [Solanum dulcamara]|uniref:uncharacterized protein LOC129901581 isoform X3 n=1 Tax=Solanum dulcamara TaxID=45834 RepID=UPI002485A857|nr:uncharacterized protein LOC129901581 isoform X3 [Solanum dulcamara]
MMEPMNPPLSWEFQDKIPVVKRFSGGGTVIVDHQTVFITFICNTGALPSVQPYPRPIMSWSSQLYSKVIQGVGDFSLRENDYVFGNHKFGGNAQSIKKGCWVHHTSFLWDYEMMNMAYLKLPKRAPDYRQVLWQKCKVRLRTIDPCGQALPWTLRIAGALVHRATLYGIRFLLPFLNLVYCPWLIFSQLKLI